MKQLFQHTALAAALSLSLTSIAFAEASEPPISLQTHQQIERAAHNNDLQAQFLLAKSLYHGLAGIQDPSQAYYWFLKSSQEGFPESDLYIGKMHQFGVVLEQDMSLAIQNYEKAAAQGVAAAHTALGELYLSGDAGSVNELAARDHFVHAVRQNDVDAQVYLALMHYEGKGVTQDHETARELFERAANQGDSYAQYSLGTLYYNDEGFIPRNLTQASKWFSMACEQNMPKACKALDDTERELSQRSPSHN